MRLERTTSGSYDPLPELQSVTILAGKIAAGGHARMPVAEKASIKELFATAKKATVWIEVSGIGRTVKIQKDHSILDLAGEGRHLSVTVQEAVPLAPDSLIDAKIQIHGVVRIIGILLTRLYICNLNHSERIGRRFSANS